jgi:hypothetical protein
MADPTFWERYNDLAFHAFLARLFVPVIDGAYEACQQLRYSQRWHMRNLKVSAGAKLAWARRRVKWGKRGRAA